MTEDEDEIEGERRRRGGGGGESSKTQSSNTKYHGTSGTNIIFSLLGNFVQMNMTLFQRQSYGSGMAEFM